jgi:Tfp pilus assembly protein PilV
MSERGSALATRASTWWRAPLRRDGLTLVECVLALLVLGAGVLAVLAAAINGVRAMRTAEVEQTAAVLAASVLDSLASLQSPSGGSAVRGAMRLDWTVLDASGTTRIQLFVSGPNATPVLVAGARAARWPVQLSRVP